MTYQEPPPGWSTFGSHVDSPFAMIFSKETGDDGLPLWEQPALFYDRQGQPLEIAKADELLGDPEYRRVALTAIGPYQVSTAWRGVSHDIMHQGPPTIFETMVFASDADALQRLGPEVDLAVRYRTEAEALTGHEEVCTLIRAVYQPMDTREEQPHESSNR